MAQSIRQIHCYEKWSDINLFDTDKTTPLYTLVNHSFSRPNVILTRAGSGSPAGTGTFHTFSSKVNCNIGGREVNYKREDMFSRTRTIRSKRGILFWKSAGTFSSNFNCIDGNTGRIVASFIAKCYAWTKAGIFEIYEDLSPDMLDEVVLTGLIMHHEENQIAVASS
ncbi:MAG: hypothetical protein M1824_004778 [Vezdaea acicularis]|nr:MAG: hypothetical protein M1824_004778 [Vezdaea acicularis]